MSELPPLPDPVLLRGSTERPIGDFYPAASVRAWGWAVRRAALEEAARACEHAGNSFPQMDGVTQQTLALWKVADLIRALADKGNT